METQQEETNANGQESPSFFKQHALGIKMLVVVTLILLLLIPANMVSNLIVERKERKEEATLDISSKWGGEQTLTGPIFSVPFKFTQLSEDKKLIEEHIGKISWVPEKLEINMKVDPEVRKRGIFGVIVYRSKVKMSGYFNPADLKIVDVSAEKIMLQKTAIELNWSDLKGLVENIDFKIGGTTYPLEPDMSDKGSLIALLDLNPLMGNKIPFECEFTIRGTNNISAIPLGKNTSMTVISSWPSPKFSGNYLPDERTIDDKGFTAVWKIPQSSRPFRQAWLGSLRNFETTSFGVDFIQPVNNYTSAERTVKYALLLIALTFLCFFFIENMKGRNIHALQYTLVGLALVLFYSLLVSFSEYISFSWSYLIAGFMTSTLISTYIFAIIKDKITAISIFLTLGALYGFIYVLVLQEDFALLFGSVGLFVILAIVMNFSRKLNWGTKLHS